MQDSKNNIDDIFRKALKDSKVEPPAYIWDNIESNIPGKSFIRGAYSKYINIAASVLLISVLTITAYYFYNTQIVEVTNKIVEKNIIPAIKKNATITDISNNNHKIETSKTKTSENKSSDHTISPNSSAKNIKIMNSSDDKSLTNAAIPKQKTNNPIGLKNSETITKRSSTEPNQLLVNSESKTSNPVSSSKDNSTLENKLINKISEDNIQKKLLSNSENLPSENNSKSSAINKDQTLGMINNNNIIPPTYISKLNRLNHFSKQYITSNYNPSEHEFGFDERHSGDKLVSRKNHPDIYLGLTYTPEYFVSRSDFLSSKKDFANSTDLGLSFVWNLLSLRTGLGLSLYRTDKFNYQVNYSSNDAVGSYNKVDSVTFIIENNIIVPQFHTTEVKVYDEVNHIYKSNIKSKYAYLQIPLIFGYKLNQQKNISFSLNCGPVVSLTLSKKTDEITYPGDGAKVTKISSNEVTRVNSYWDMMLSLGMNYVINSSFTFNLEPQLRTGISSVYSASNPQAKKPYSIGLRTGIMYKL